MKQLLKVLYLLLLLGGISCERQTAPQVIIQSEPSVESLVSSVLNGGGVYRDVAFSQLIETSTGNRVLPMNPEEPVDAEILAGLEAAIARVLKKFNRDSSPTNTESRINEVSAYFEEALLGEIGADPAMECDYPRTAEGNLQRAGYPDLMIRHIESGRVIYLDPKVVADGSMKSSLRTFYFTPRRETNKVLHDAHHLLVGIEHDGNTGNWKFLRWHLVDLTAFKVTLKAEFQANNKNIYRPELILQSGKADE